LIRENVDARIGRAIATRRMYPNYSQSKSANRFWTMFAGDVCRGRY